MSNEIKVGDKVRVSEDAPKMYYNGYYTSLNCIVCDMEDDTALIELNMGETRFYHAPIAIPTKYLVKVVAEKEAKIKVGDKVRIKGGGYEPNLHKGDVGEVLDINDKEQCFVLFKKSQAWIYTDCLEPYTEPTEQTEAEEDARIRQMEAELDEFRKAELDKVLHPEKYHTYEVEVNPNFINWTSYKANLAKEIVLKVVNRYTDPKEAAEYAVQTVEAVVAGLKRK